LADLKGYTNFAEDTTLWDIAYNGDVTENGHNYYDDLVQYFSYATNSSLEGVCTVNKELAELLKKVDQIVGFDENDNEFYVKTPTDLWNLVQNHVLLPCVDSGCQFKKAAQ
jgi:hypothetical protein